MTIMARIKNHALNVSNIKNTHYASKCFQRDSNINDSNNDDNSTNNTYIQSAFGTIITKSKKGKNSKAKKCNTDHLNFMNVPQTHP